MFNLATKMKRLLDNLRHKFGYNLWPLPMCATFANWFAHIVICGNRRTGEMRQEREDQRKRKKKLNKR